MIPENKVPRMVQALEEICIMELPELYPRAISFECIDPRLLKSYRKISRVLGYNKGELFPNKTKGAINDLLSSNESIKLNCHETTELLIDKGIDTVILTSHTDCAADKALWGGPKPYEEDKKHQLEKLKRAYKKTLEYSQVKLLELRILCFFLDIRGKEVKIIRVRHYMSDDVNHQEEIEAATLVSAAV